MPDRDRAPIDQKWIQDYCDSLARIAESLGPESVMGLATTRRLEVVMDLVDAWQKRHWPRETHGATDSESSSR